METLITRMKMQNALWLMFWSLISVHPVSAELVLVGELDGRRFDQFRTDGGVILADERTESEVPLMGGTHWRVEGDLVENIEYVAATPTYRIDRSIVATGGIGITHRRIATVFLTRESKWSDSDLDGGLAVMLWVIDGDVVSTDVSPIRVNNGPSGNFGALFSRELPEEKAEGYPVLLVWKGGGFLAGESNNSRLMAMAHLGSLEDFKAALSAVESKGDQRELNSGPWLNLVVRTGRMQLVEAAIVFGAELESRRDNGFTAVWHAACLGRDQIVERLLEIAAANRGKGRGKNFMPKLAESGHLGSAMAMVRDGHRNDANYVVGLALWLGEYEIAKELLRMKIRQPLKVTMDSSLVRAVSAGDAELVKLLLKARMSASVEGARSTALIEAVKSRNAEVVKLLLKARAKVDAKDQGGFRAMDYAVAGQDEGVMELLREAGAKPSDGAGLRVRIVTPQVIESVDQKDLPVAAEAGSNDPANKSLVVSDIAPFIRLIPNYVYQPGDGAHAVGFQGPVFTYLDDRSRAQDFWGVVSVLVNGQGKVVDLVVVAKSERMERRYLISVVQSLDFSQGIGSEKSGFSRFNLPILVDNW